MKNVLRIIIIVVAIATAAILYSQFNHEPVNHGQSDAQAILGY